MKIFAFLDRFKFSIILVALFGVSLLAFSQYLDHSATLIPRDLSNFNRFMYKSVNRDLVGDWAVFNSTFFEKSAGFAQFRFNGDPGYFLKSNFQQGVYSLSLTLNEKFQISTTNVGLTLTDGILNPIDNAITFERQQVEVEFVKLSKSYYVKMCTVAGLAEFDAQAHRSAYGLNHFLIQVKSDDCPEVTSWVVSSVAATPVKGTQVHFHFCFSMAIILAQFYFVGRLEEQVQQNLASGYQVSVMTVLTLATFQLFNGFEQFIFSAFGYPSFWVMMLVGVFFLFSFFQTIVRLMAGLLQRQLNAQVEDNPEFSHRTYLLFSYLVCHGTILASFFASMQFSDNSLVYVYWAAAIVPQIIKNLFSEYRFLEKNRNLAAFYFLVMLYTVYQHFYRQNFAFVSEEGGFTEARGIEVLGVSLAGVAILVIQEMGNYQRFFARLRGIQGWDYFKTLQQVREEKGGNFEESDCTICLSGFGETTSCHDITTEVDNDQLKEFVKEFNPGPVMLCPCKHIFHTGCLLSWMAVKMECPSCRTKLPPLT